MSYLGVEIRGTIGLLCECRRLV